MSAALSPATIVQIGNWLASSDSGISSRTMLAIAMGATEEGDFDAPYDWSDFGRCKRLVEAAPELRDHFQAIGARVPAFKGILDNWDELCLSHAAAKRGDSFYRRITELRGDRQ